MKHFNILFLALIFTVSGFAQLSGQTQNTEPPREKGQKSVLQLAVDPIPTVRVGFIGLGNRGTGAVGRYTFIEGVEIKALCDLDADKVKRSQNTLAKRGLKPADEYTGENAWKELCRRKDIDLIYICTDWLHHTPMAVYAMQQGKHVAIEVPAATSIEECWQLVDTAEKTRKHCMMLENCCYDFFELNTLNKDFSGILSTEKAPIFTT